MANKGFQKGNKLQPKKGEKITIPTDYLGEFVNNGGLKGLSDILQKLANNEEVGENQMKFLYHFKDYLPFAKAKLTRPVDENGEDLVPIINVALFSKNEIPQITSQKIDAPEIKITTG